MNNPYTDNIDKYKISQIIINVTKDTYMEFKNQKHENEESNDDQNQEIWIKENSKSLVAPEIYSIKDVTQN